MLTFYLRSQEGKFLISATKRDFVGTCAGLRLARDVCGLAISTLGDTHRSFQANVAISSFHADVAGLEEVRAAQATVARFGGSDRCFHY